MRMRNLYKKSLLLLILLFAVGWQAMATESCGIVFNLHDSYGDGWNGNKLVVSDGNALNEELTFNNGSSASFTLFIAEGSHVTLSWIEGDFSDECSFSVQFENGYPIHESGNLSGTSYEFDLNCDDANTPVTITVALADGGGGSVSGGGEFVCGETCTVTATPNEGYVFFAWSDIDENIAISTEATYTFTVSGPKNLGAAFRPVSNVNNIVFEDPNVEVICLEEWDADRDLYLSYTEAAAVTDLGNVFKGNEAITSFDELQYFTGLTSLIIEGNWQGPFSGCTNLSSIVIPSSVTEIGEGAFQSCASLTSITIPSSVTEIGVGAFYGTGITLITIPSSVSTIGGWLFGGCVNLEQIIVEEGNPTYDSRDNCNAIIETNTNTLIAGCKNTIIPNSVTSIGATAFVECYGLSAIVIPNLVISIGEGAFESCSGLVSITIPNSVTNIGDYAFYGCESLTSIVIPNSVNSIGEGAFENCYSLTSITFPNSLTTIGNWAFAYCESLTSLNIPGSVTSIGNQAFGWCTNLTSITVLSLTPPALDSNVFQNVDTSLPVYIPGGTFDAYSSADGWSEFTNFIESNAIVFADDNVKTICVDPEIEWDTDGDGELSYVEAAAVTDLGNVFQYNEDITSFDELQYFTGLTAIGDYAFTECTSLTSISIPSSVTAIGESAFEFAGLTVINIPNSITSIGMNAFNYCESLVSVTLPDALTTIEENVFGGCSSLTSINIPGSVTSIGDGAFSWCNGLVSMTVNATTPPVLGGTSVFDEVDKSIPVYVPGGTADAYRTANGWDDFFNFVENSIVFDDDLVEAICLDYWDADQDGLLSFDEAAAVTDLGGAFQGNEDITSFNELQYFTGLTSIGNRAFAGCDNLNSIVLPETLTSIGDGAFMTSGPDVSSGLTSITIPNMVTSIGDVAFAGLGLTSITIPNSVTSIGINPFMGCTGLETIMVETGNQVYDSRDNCNAIIETSTNTLIAGCKNTTIPNTVASIEARAFYGCTGLTSMVIPSSVEYIGEYAFAGCTGLTSMIIFNTNVEMGDNVFDGVEFPEDAVISASASPADGGGLFGLSQDGGGTVFVGTLVNDFSIEFASQGSGEIPSNYSVLLMAKPNEGWQFVEWQINGELVSDEALLMFRAFGEFAFEALFEPCGVESEPELLNGRFSVSDCTTVGFARSNTIMSMSDLSMVEAVLFGVEIPGLHYEIGENQWDRMTYDASALNGNSEAYEELLLTGADILPSFMLKNNVDCWHIPTWREWDYMLNQRETASGIRFAYGIVNDVSGLIILPDDWEASTYNALSNVNEIGNYDNNVIDTETWTTVLEPAGAVFLPANGYIVQGALIQESSDGQAVGAYPGLLFSPNGDFMMGQIEGFPMTGPMTLMLDMVTMFGMMNSSNSSSFGGTSLRLAKLMESSTATITLTTNGSERGTVSGAGEFACQQECTVTATANDGYVFMYWLEDGVAISHDPVYSFKLFGDRNLTAVFAPVDEVCQMIIETTAPSGASFLLEWFGMGLSMSFDDGTPPYHLPFGTTPESLDFLDIMQLMQSMQSGNTNTNYTHTINVIRGSNASLDIMISEDLINFMMASGDSVSELGLTFNVRYSDGEALIENATELPYTFLCNCEAITLFVDPEEGGEILKEGELNIGESVTLTAVANEHYYFVNWTLNGVVVSSDPTYSFVVTAGGEMVAHFEAEPTYTVAVSVNPDESGTASFFDLNNAPVDFEDSTIPNEWNNAISSYPWIMWNSNPHTGSYCMASSNYNVNSSSSFIDATFEFVEDGSIEFYSRVSSESASFDWGSFYIDGVEQFREGGTSPNTWTLHHYEVTAGIHTFRWYYRKDNSVTSGEDRYFIDDIVFTGLFGGSVFYYGETCVLVATPAENYHFVNWIENGAEVSTENPYSFTVTGNRDLVANFALDYYDITAEASPEECGTVTGAGTYNYGIECTLNATANVGYTFINWTLDGNVVSTEPSYTFTVTGGGAYVANFMLNSYTIMASANPSEGGTVSGAGGYNHFETCTLTATASEGYDFNNWTLDGEVVSTNPTYTFMVTGPAEYVANFSLKTYDITATVTPTNAGSVTGMGNYTHGSQCTLTATPNEGYTLINWTLNGTVVSTEPEYTFTVTAAGDYTANFQLKNYVINASANPSEGGMVNGAGNFDHGTECTLTATANVHYHFTGWMENGLVVCETPIFTFTVTSNRTFEATFAVNGYYSFSLAVEPEESGTLYTAMYHEIETPYETEEPVEETDISVVAKANEGWRFAYWTANGEMVPDNNVYTFHLSGNTDLVAHFEQCELETEPDPDLLSGRFSISGCTTVGFAKGNVIAQIQIDTINPSTEYYNPTSASWQFAETQYYRQEYNAEYIVNNGIGNLLSEGMDLVWDVYRYVGLVDIGCWHNLTGTEWEYLLNGRPTAVRYAFAKVNDVAGLLVLPDDWVASTYMLNSPNTVTAYETNTISQMDWENTLEPYGALFLPANGMLITSYGDYYYDFDDGTGNPIGLYGSLLFHPDLGLTNGGAAPFMNEITSTMFSSMRLAQIMDQETSTVTVAVEETQTSLGMVSGGGIFACGAECTIMAIANEGYVFQYWLEGEEVVSVDASYTFTVEGDRNLTAVFAEESEVCIVEFELYSDDVALGWGGEALQLTFDDGTPSISLTMPAPEVDWNSIRIAQLFGNYYDFDFPQSRTINVPIHKLSNVELSWLALSTNIGPSLYNSFSASYETGEPILVNIGNDHSPISFLCNCTDIHLYVNPVEAGYIVTDGELFIGESVTLTAFANYGYSFVNWTFNDIEVSTEPIYSFEVTEPGNIVANFELVSFEITATSDPVEGGIVNGQGLYEYNTNCTLTAEPNEGYTFMYWSENGEVVSSNAVYTFLVTADRDLVANFSPPLTITTEGYPYEGGIVNGGGEYNYGAICTITAEPNDGYIFNYWTENGIIVSTAATYSFSVTHNCTLAANFSHPNNVGILSGLFSVGENERVNFSQGNLQYQASNRVWRFASNQYDYIGSDNSNISASYSGWIDLFGWGTSGYNHGAVCYQPWSTSAASSDYYAYGSDTYNLFDQTGQADWGCNAINNGGNTANSSFRTLTYEEWQYILYSRSTVSGIRFAKARVNGVNGMILLPDDWKTSIYRLYNTNNDRSSCDSNVITAEIWSNTLEANGAVFLPAAGVRYGTSISDVGSYGFYWSASYQNSYYAWRLPFASSANTIPIRAMSRNYGQSVRLVSSLLSISASPNPEEGGTITGRLGEYVYGTECVLSATPNEGYAFSEWTENEETVSTESNYSFIVTNDRSLTAVFKPTYVIYAEANNPVYGIVSGEGTFVEGETCTLTATANEGYGFLAWTEDGVEVSTETVYSFTVTEERHLVAVFNTLFTITACANPIEGGHVSFVGGIDEITVHDRATTNYYVPLYGGWADAYLKCEMVYPAAELGYLTEADITSMKFYASQSNVSWGNANFQVFLAEVENEQISAFYGPGTIVYEGALSIVNGEMVVDFNFPYHYNGGNLLVGVYNTVTGSYVSSNWYGETVSGASVQGYNTNSLDAVSPTRRNFLPKTTFSFERSQAMTTFLSGANCTVAAQPNEGSDFVNWTENGVEVSTDAEYSFIVTNDRNLVANFYMNTFEITATATPAEGGTITGAGEFYYGAQCSLTATPNENYIFLSWTENGETLSTDVNYTFTVTGDRSLMANFVRVYTITASANPAEGGTIGKDYYYDNEAFVTNVGNSGQIWWSVMFPAGTYSGDMLTKVSAYDIQAMTGTVTIYNDGDNAPTNLVGSRDVSFTGVNGFVDFVFDTPISIDPTKNVWVVFYNSGDATHPIACCNNTGDANGRWISSDGTTWDDLADYNLNYTFMVHASIVTSQYVMSYQEGETCTLMALPNEGYGLSEWTENGETVSTDANYSFTVTGDRNLVAVFLPTHVITAEANNADYGTVTGGGTYVEGETCTLVATPAEGYEFINWTENGETVHTEAEYSFIVEGDRNLIANFSLKHYDITAEANPEEGGMVTGGGNYGHWSQCTLTATANFGYTFINWTLDGNVVSTEPSYTFTVTSAGDYTANFQLNNYAINAFANPSEGGSVSGAGNYDHGTECTLTATANVGYTFVNWTLDGVEVSTDPTYTFTVYEEATYVANFSLNLYEITAIANPVEGGTITGAGNYYHGDECILTAIPIENYTFLYWTENGNYLSSDAIYSFVATSDRSLVAVFAGNEQTISLSPGWTWLSSYIEMEDNDGLGMLENGLDPNGVMIKSQRDGFVSYAGGMWIGTLDGISNEKMYLVNTNEASDVTFTGPVANMMNHPITLNPNWTWLGYPVPFAVDINDALANLNASEGDVVKTQSSFATYSTNDGWSGSLNQLTPGMGLMYQSHNSQPVTFNYGVGMSRALKANLTAENNHWVPDIHAYPNNMSVMAVVKLNGEELQDERYELAVFNGSECRGSARLAYVPSLHRYVAFLTVTGEDDVELYLALYDTMTGKAYYNTTDCPNFEANAVLGSLSMPFVARFGGTTDVDEWDAPNIELYPNPVVAGHLFQMEMPAECQGARVSIVNALGAVISTTDVYDEPITLRAPAVPGVYTVRIVTAKQGTYCRKLIVK